MSSISGLGSASSAWASTASTQSGSRLDRLFNKVDADGGGSVDSTELQTMLDKVSKATGNTAADATEVIKKADADGDGSLSKAELGEAMKSLRPTDGSTVDFAQRGRPPAGAGGPPPGGAGGPPPSASTSSSTSTSTDPLDTNGDGTVSASERAAGDLKSLLADLAQAAKDSSAASGTSSSSGTSSQTASAKSEVDFGALAKTWLQQYQQSASTAATSTASSLSLSA